MKKIIAIIIIVLVLVTAVFLILRGGEVTTEENIDTSAPTEILRVGDVSAATSPIIAYGQVVSSNSVAVVPETSGVVKRVYKTLGQTVRAGETVIELQNSSEQQAVLQAQSSLSSAQASLQRTLRGADDDQVAQAQAAVAAQQSALAQTETSVLSGLDGVYVSLDQFIGTEFDEFFTNPNTNFPRFKFDSLDDDSRESLEERLVGLNQIVEQDRKYSNPDDALEVASRIINEFQTYTNNLRSTVLEISSSSVSDATLSRWGSELAQARNDLESNRVTLSSLRSSLVSAKNNLSSAQAVLAEVQDGADSEDVTIAQSGVSANSAGLSSAQIQLAKTFIKAPTFGQVSSIEARVGQLVGPSSPVFIISSNDAKRIDVNLTEKEVARISVGSRVVIDGLYEGSVARIAPTINQSTGKVKVEIFPTETITLTEGAGVGVSIETISSSLGFSLPIESVFVRGDSSYVYKVQNGKAVPSIVETNGLFGPTVIVTAGLNADERIVVFARGVKDNQMVEQVEKPLEQIETPESDLSATTSVDLTETE